MRRASQRISAASVELISCANRVAEEGGGVEEEDNPCLLDNLHETLESTELLRRDWASQVIIMLSSIWQMRCKLLWKKCWLIFFLYVFQAAWVKHPDNLLAL